MTWLLRCVTSHYVRHVIYIANLGLKAVCEAAFSDIREARLFIACLNPIGSSCRASFLAEPVPQATAIACHWKPVFRLDATII